MGDPLAELRTLMLQARLSPCAIHPAIARVDEFSDEGPDPVFLLAWPHDRRTEEETFAIGKLFCRMHYHLPALLAVCEAAKKVHLIECDITAPDYELSAAVRELGNALSALKPNQEGDAR